MEAMRVRCTHEDCCHEWDYRGTSRFYLTCPQCYRKVKVIHAIKAKENADET